MENRKKSSVGHDEVGTEFNSETRRESEQSETAREQSETRDETLVSSSDEEPMPRSRMNNRMVKETKQTIIYSVVGAIIILILLFKIGIPLFSKLGLYVSDKTNSGSTTTNTNNSDNVYIAPPILDATFTATNSATVKITGKTDKGKDVKIFVNNSAQDTTTSHGDGTFVFENVQLDSGQNTIQAKTKVNDKYSDFSNTLSILYSQKGPDLTIDNPSDGSTTKESNQTVSGSTDSEATVTVNDHVAIVSSSGAFSYPISLQNGDNTIKIVATDAAGNKTEKDIKISLQP